MMVVSSGVDGLRHMHAVPLAEGAKAISGASVGGDGDSWRFTAIVRPVARWWDA
jgi:hypothetical protein